MQTYKELILSFYNSRDLVVKSRKGPMTQYYILPFIHFSPNGLIFVSNTYSCFVLTRVENYFKF
jgi:hypothetical protein